MKHKRRIVILGVMILTLVAVPAVTFAFNWSTPVMIAGGRQWNTNPAAAADRDGHVYVVWNTSPWWRDLLFRSFDGSQWSGTQKIHGGVTNNQHADIAVGPSGFPHIVWYGEFPGSKGNLFY